MFALSGRVVIKRGSVTRLILNAAYPLIDRFVIAFETLSGPYGVHVCIGKTWQLINRVGTIGGQSNTIIAKA